MDFELREKKAFISGSTQGIGYAIARTLLIEGAAVVVNGRNEEGVQSAVRRLGADVPGANVTGLAADFGKPREVESLLDELGDVDILVNNVGLFELKEFEQIADDDWQRFFEVNVMSGVRLSRRLLGGMLARGWGRILFVSSESGVNVPVDMVHYGSTKAAMIALSNGLAKRTRGTHVTVNAILGGPTFSDGVATTVESIATAQGIDAGALKATLAANNQTSLVERFLESDEVAAFAAYLVSSKASATNGAALRADGGVLTTLF